MQASLLLLDSLLDPHPLLCPTFLASLVRLQPPFLLLVRRHTVSENRRSHEARLLYYGQAASRGLERWQPGQSGVQILQNRESSSRITSRVANLLIRKPELCVGLSWFVDTGVSSREVGHVFYHPSPEHRCIKRSLRRQPCNQPPTASDLRRMGSLDMTPPGLSVKVRKT